MTPVVHRGPGHVRMRLLNNNIHVSSELRLGEILVCFVRCSIIALLRVAARTARSFFFRDFKIEEKQRKRQEEYIKVSIEPEWWESFVISRDGSLLPSYYIVIVFCQRERLSSLLVVFCLPFGAGHSLHGWMDIVFCRLAPDWCCDDDFQSGKFRQSPRLSIASTIFSFERVALCMKVVNWVGSGDENLNNYVSCNQLSSTTAAATRFRNEKSLKFLLSSCAQSAWNLFILCKKKKEFFLLLETTA